MQYIWKIFNERNVCVREEKWVIFHWGGGGWGWLKEYNYA